MHATAWNKAPPHVRVASLVHLQHSRPSDAGLGSILLATCRGARVAPYAAIQVYDHPVSGHVPALS